MIKNIVFDLGNVLVPVYQEKTTAAFQATFTDADKHREAIEALALKYELGNISTSIFINGMLDFGDYRTQALDIITAWNAMLSEVPESSIKLLNELGERYNIYILSNTNELHLQWINRNLQSRFELKAFDDLVKRAFYSHKLHLRKPDPAIYQFLLDAEHITAGETVFIDDIKENVDAAIRCGIHGLHATTFAEAEGILKEYINDKG